MGQVSENVAAEPLVFVRVFPIVGFSDAPFPCMSLAVRGVTFSTHLHAEMYARVRVPSPLRDAWLLAVFCLASLSSCDRHLHIPEAPDLTPLAADYERPTGELGAQVTPEVVTGIVQRFDDIAAVEQLDWVRRMLQDFSSTELDRKGRVPKGLEGHLDFVAVTELQKQCQPDAEGDRGQLELTAVLEEQGVYRTLWGYFSACRFRSEVASNGSGSQLTGRVVLRLDGVSDHVPLGDVRATSYLIEFRGRVTPPNGSPLTRHLHFRFVPPNELQVLHDAENGESYLVQVERSVVSTPAPDIFDVTLTDRIGAWSCRIDRGMQAGACADDTSMRPSFSF